MGVASGTAATMNPNTELCKLEDVEVHFKTLQKSLVSSPGDYNSLTSLSTITMATPTAKQLSVMATNTIQQFQAVQVSCNNVSKFKSGK